MKDNFKIPGVSFSLKRALGITKAKQDFARKIGIPTSKAGLERKIGNLILKSIFGNTSVRLKLQTGYDKLLKFIKK